VSQGRTGIAAVDAVVEEAIGYGHRHDPVASGTGGPAGNARLTSWVGVLLLGLSLAELVTLLDVTGLIQWHVGVGIVMTGLALAKTASTGWRIVRYYAGSTYYGSAGPPPMILRLLGPLVVLSTLGVLGSGIALIAIGQSASEGSWFAVLGQQVSPVTVHQLFFVLFAVFVGLHVLARLVPALLQVSGRVRRGQQRLGVPGRGMRAVTVVVSVVAGIAAVMVVLPVSGWHHDHFRARDQSVQRVHAQP
jgi:hypothetical protein